MHAKNIKRMRKVKFPKTLLHAFLEDLLLLRRIVDIDPVTPVKKFLGMYPPLRTILWSDATGFEHDQSNPRKGQLAGFWASVYHKACRFAFTLAFNQFSKAFSRAFRGKPKLQTDIHFLELLAAVITLVVFIYKFAKRVKGRTIVIKVDNTCTVSWINNGRCHSKPWNGLLKLLWILEVVFDTNIVCVWVPSEQQKADFLTRSQLVAKKGNSVCFIDGIRVPVESDILTFQPCGRIIEALGGCPAPALVAKFLGAFDSFKFHPAPVTLPPPQTFIRSRFKNHERISSIC